MRGVKMPTGFWVGRANINLVKWRRNAAILAAGVNKMSLQDQLYVFVDNSFLFLQGYKHVQVVAKLPPTKHPYVDYLALRRFLQKQGELKRAVIVGSDLPGSMISKCQAAGFEVSTFPRYPDFKTGLL